MTAAEDSWQVKCPFCGYAQKPVPCHIISRIRESWGLCDMRVTYDENRGLFIVQGVPEAPRFERIEGAIGWLNDKGKDKALLHWMVVCAMTEEKKFVFLEESLGIMSKIAMRCVNAKDRLLIERYHVDERSELLVRDLRNEDGLCRYDSKGKDALGRQQYYHTENHWPDFRDRETLSRLIPVPDDELADMQAGLDRLAGGIKKRDIEVRRECRHLQAALRLPAKEALDHPGIHAAVWVHNSLLRAKKSKPNDQKQVPTYGNVRR